MPKVSQSELDDIFQEDSDVPQRMLKKGGIKPRNKSENESAKSVIVERQNALNSIKFALRYTFPKNLEQHKIDAKKTTYSNWVSKILSSTEFTFDTMADFTIDGNSDVRPEYHQIIHKDSGLALRYPIKSVDTVSDDRMRKDMTTNLIDHYEHWRTLKKLAKDSFSLEQTLASVLPKIEVPTSSLPPQTLPA